MSNPAVPVTTAPVTAAPTRAQAMQSLKTSTTSAAPAPAVTTAPISAPDRTIQPSTDVPDTDAPTDAPGTESAPELELTPPEPEHVDWQAKYNELLDSGDLHETLFEKMLMAKIDGQEVPVSVKEALAGYQRRSDYSRHMNEVAQARQAIEAERAQITNLWSTLKGKPDMALEVFGERFGDAWLDGLVQTRQAQRQEYQDAQISAGYRACLQLGLDPNSPEAAQNQQVRAAMIQEGQRLDRVRQMEAENKKLRKAQEQTQMQAQQQTQAQEVQSYEQYFNSTLARFQEAALKAEGLSANSVNRAELKYAVAQVLQARNYGQPTDRQSNKVTQDVVREAAQILKETRGTKPAQQTEQPLPSRQGMGTGSGQPVARTNAGPKTRAELVASLKLKQR
jgi:hypothetical protein